MDDFDYEKDLLGVTILKKGLTTLNDAMSMFELALNKAEEILKELKSLPPFKPDYGKFYWITKFDEVDAIIESLGTCEDEEVVEISSLFEESDIYEKACNVLEKYRFREENFDDSMENSFHRSNNICDIQNSTMLLVKDKEYEKWKEDLFGVSFVVMEKYNKNRDNSNFWRSHQEITFRSEDLAYTCDEIGNSINEILNNDIVDMYEDIDNVFVLMPEEDDDLEEKLELPANLSEFNYEFDTN